ncbi:MAG: M23 family metallopeptidase [Ruminococcaceae bacterium]|nr:M23 family metallopeptidase [Oscillospiraceae bacterium]
MPVKRKDKKKSAEKQPSAIVSLFKRFNKDKVTFDGVKKFLTAFFYRLGYSAELTVILIWKKVKHAAYILYRYLKRIWKEVKIFIDRMLESVFEDIGFPLARLKASFYNIKNILKKSKEDTNVKAQEEVKAYVKQGVKKHKKFLPVFMSYCVPAFFFVVMVTVIVTGLRESYAIEVSLDGESIGYVNNYTTITNADSVIRNKLVTLEEDQKWSMNPEIKVVTTIGKDIIDERQLSDRILQASDENIVSATGLYVDGKFYGAVEDSTKIRNAMESMLAPYMDGNENKTVNFVQDVSLTDGIFFTETIVDENDLAEMVTGLVEGEVWYTVVSGDSPSRIASKNNLRLRELYNLNPGLEGGGLWVGDQVLVSQAVPFLQVKEVVREVRDVEVAYKTEHKPNNSMALGKTKTVQQGQKGINKVTVDVTYIDGIAQNETVIETVVVKEPVTEIVEVGRYLSNGVILENAGTGAFGWPTGGGVRISRGFAGQYPAHNGVDIAGPYGTPIYAADSGVVTTAKYTRTGYGVYVIIDHGNGYQTVYGHNSSLVVSYGQQVKKGQLIAYMGSTGNSTGNHLHFEIKSGNTRYDPYKFW